MYPHFIEVHDHGRPLTINIDSIIGFNSGDRNNGWITIGQYRGEKVYLTVDESYDELKEIIRNSGCLISKIDSQIDTKPLTMADLDGLIGEPVWDSNRREWGLVVEHLKSDDDYEWVTIRPYKDVSHDYDEEDLLKYPLYRMKVTK